MQSPLSTGSYPLRLNTKRETNKRKENTTQHNKPWSAYTLFSGFPIFHQLLALSFLIFLSFIITSPTFPTTFTFSCVSIHYSFGLFWVKKQTQTMLDSKKERATFAWLLLQQFKVLYSKDHGPSNSTNWVLILIGSPTKLINKKDTLSVGCGWDCTNLWLSKTIEFIAFL